MRLQQQSQEVLTGDEGGLLKGCGDLRVKLNHVVLDDLRVAGLHPLLDPRLEGLAYLGVEHVDDEL